MEQAVLPEWPSRKGKAPAAKKAKLSISSVPSEGEEDGTKVNHIPNNGQGLAFMALDIVEEPNGYFHIWGTLVEGGSVLVRVEDFQPYLYVALPRKQDQGLEPSTEDVEELKSVWNRSLPANGRIQRMEVVSRKPIMFYRPDRPDGADFLKISFPRGMSMKKAGKAVHGAKAAIQSAGYHWENAQMHEHEGAGHSFPDVMALERVSKLCTQGIGFRLVMRRSEQAGSRSKL